MLEVYNARLLFDTYNDEALRFARKYGLLMGAGSDAHVLQGVGTGALRMRRFDGPEEFLLSLRTATVLRRPKSLAYLQSLKWVAQVREKVGSGRRRRLELEEADPASTNESHDGKRRRPARQDEARSPAVQGPRRRIEPDEIQERYLPRDRGDQRARGRAARARRRSTCRCWAAAIPWATSSSSSTVRPRARSRRGWRSSAARARRCSSRSSVSRSTPRRVRHQLPQRDGGPGPGARVADERSSSSRSSSSRWGRRPWPS